VKAFGERTTHAALESEPAHPRDAYGRSKLAAEEFLRRFEWSAGGETVIVRPTLVYGPGVRANFLSLLELADSAWPLPLADAIAPRSFVFIDNLVDALLFVCDCPAAAGRTFFVSDGRDVAVAEMVRAIRERLGRPARLVGFPAPMRESSRVVFAMFGIDLRARFDRLFEPLQVDPGALFALGWTPPTGFDASLDETVRWYRSR
jgi:nucleoside-diphosphate-sugar epimerase